MSNCSLLWAYLLGVLLTSAEREIDSPVFTSKGEPDLLVLVKKKKKKNSLPSSFPKCLQS